MTDVAEILSEFIAAWNAGERPRMDAYLARVPPAERDELADEIETFLMLAPEPAYDPEIWSAMTSDPLVAALAGAAMEPAPQPPARVRERAGLSLAEVAGRLGFSGAQRAKAERYLGEVEQGVRRPSRMLRERVAQVLGATPEGLAWPSASAPAFGLHRAAGDAAPDERIEILADALLADDEEWDEVDELFNAGE